jgi:short-subunit dehydrogenase
MADGRMKGKRALVTGASSGIGAELARTLASEGAHLVIVARREDRLRDLADALRKEHGVEVDVVALDLAAPGAADALYAATEGAGRAVDVLVNNAGFGDYRYFVDIEWDRYAAMIQLNITTLTELTHLFVSQMIRRRSGQVMNIASVAAYMPNPSFAVYGATKVYVRNFTEALDCELKGTGVRAICVCPGGTRTEFLEQAGQKLKASGEMAMMTSAKCARIAVDKMLAGRRNVVVGLMNGLSVFVMRFVPRAWMPALAKIFMDAGVERVPRIPAPETPSASEN